MQRNLARLLPAEELALLDAFRAVAALEKAVIAGDLVICGPIADGVLPFPRRPGRSPLETLDSMAHRLDALVKSNSQIADDIQPISEDLLGLRIDIAELFSELKAGNRAAAAAHEEQEHEADASRERVEARLNHLEDRSDH